MIFYFRDVRDLRARRSVSTLEEIRRDSLTGDEIEKRGIRMCLAIPARVIEKSEDGMLRATVGDGPTCLNVSGLLLPEPVEIGDYVIVHAGFAMHKIDRIRMAGMPFRSVFLLSTRKTIRKDTAYGNSGPCSALSKSAEWGPNSSS